MKTGEQRNFNKRAFVAIVAAISGIGLPLSGFANHLLQGDPISLHRHAWMTIHWSLGIIFVVFALWHAILNRRALQKHISGASFNISAFSREFVLARNLVGITLLCSIIHAFIAD